MRSSRELPARHRHLLVAYTGRSPPVWSVLAASWATAYLGNTAAELSVWTRRSSSYAQRAADVRAFFRDVTILEVDVAVAEKFGEIRSHQLSVGQFTPEMDLLIASTALVHGLTLVTHNVKDFVCVPGLQFVDWLIP